MTTTLNAALISSRNPKFVFTDRSHVTTPTKFFIRVSRSRTSVVKCSSNSEGAEIGDLKEALTDMVGERVEELMKREENRALLEGLEAASQRVARAKRELAVIEKQEIEAKLLRHYVEQLETRAAEIAECQKEISEARAMVEEAEYSLSLNMDGVGAEDALMEKESGEIDKDEERWESIKAASVSALVGTFAGVPISLTHATSSSQLMLSLAVTCVSCALFGITFRYTVRRNLDNVQLKTGTSAAFGIVKGLATLTGGPPLELDTGSFLSHAIDGAVYVSENLYIFVFAAVGLDFCFKMRLLSLFPIKKSASKTKIS